MPEEVVPSEQSATIARLEAELEMAGARVAELESLLAVSGGPGGLFDLEKSFFLLGEAAGAAFYRLRFADMKYDYLGPAIEALTGYTLREIGRLTFASMVKRMELPGGRTLDREAVRARRQADPGGDFQADYLVVTKSGEEKWLSDRSIPWRDEGDRVIGSLGVLVDITDRKRSEAELLKSEERYRALFENAALGVAVVQDGRFILANARAGDIWGRPAHELVGLTLDDVIHPDDLTMVKERHRLRMVQVAEPPETYPLRIIDSLGDTRWIQLNVKRIEWDGQPAALGFVLDITDQVEIERTLVTSEEKYAKAFRLGPHAIVIATRAEGRYIEVNEAFGVITGHAREEALGRTVEELGIWEDPEDRRRILGEVAARGRVRDREVIFRHKSGRPITVSLSTEVIDIDGQPCLFSTFNDITERSRMQRDRERLIAQLQEALASVKQLSGLLPICAHCKKIRDDQGYWRQIEQYLHDHSQAQFSHGVCPECARKFYPDIYDGKDR